MLKVKVSVALVIISLFVVSCSARHQVVPDTGKQVVLIKGVPFFPQEPYQCGPASLASVLNFYGYAVTPGEIQREVGLKNVKGTLTIDLVLFALNRGFHVKEYSGGLDDLKRTVSEGYPVIVLVDYGMGFYQLNHFMVVIGYTPEGVIVHSGRQRAKLIPYKNFLKAWKKVNYWSLLIKP